ncbi:MAG: ABC transporter ATP-binding protein [Desulfobacteraceae bacterium]|nr:MAG: ABC transporter ATP-binding protein [Desulfobacteraceae bacterium]
MAVIGSDQRPALSLNGVSKSFEGIEAVVDVNMEIATGESRALIGPNGAGKSTLFNLITGEIPRDKGRILVRGWDVTHQPVRRRIELGVGRTYQTSNLFMDMTVRENLFLSVWKRGRPPAGPLATLFRAWTGYARQFTQVMEVAEQVGLNNKLEVPVSELSHGEHRQLELGLTLGHKPAMLLLDEPMAGLSANERAFMTNLIMGLRGWITILIIEHDIDIAFRVADKVSVLHQGRIIAEGTPSEVRANRLVQEIYTLSQKGNGRGHA